MKKYFFLMSLFLVCVMTGCRKNENNPQVTKVTLSKVDIAGVSYLMVVNPIEESLKAYDLKADTSNLIPYLCARNNSGDLEVVTFQYEMEGATDAAKSFVENNLFVVPTSFVSIGQNYIWLRDCRYFMTNKDQCPEELQTVLSAFDNEIYQYIIRKKDGVVLDLSETESIVRLYDNSDFYIPKGYISPTENGFYILTSMENARLIKVTDNNTSKPAVETIVPSNCYIGSFVRQNDVVAAMGLTEERWKPMVFFPDGKIEIVNLRKDTNWEGGRYNVMFSVGGKIYCSVCFKNEFDQSELTTYRLNITELDVSVDSLCSQIVPFVYSDVAEYMPRYSEESTIAFMSGKKLISFSAETEKFEMKEIAEFSNVAESYPSLDGCIYGYENNLLEKVYRYNVNTKEATEIMIDKSSVVPFGYAPRPEFSASKNIFIQYGENSQGHDMTVVTDITVQSAYYIEAEGKRVSSIYKLQ